MRKTEFLNKNQLSKGKVIAYRKILSLTDEGLVIHLGRYLNEVKNRLKWGQNGVRWVKKCLNFLAVEISDNERQLDKICLHIALHLGVLAAAMSVNAVVAKLHSR
jgi:hypothetical protein